MIANARLINGRASLWRRIAGAGAESKLHWLLRLGVIMEFVGHGACGVHTKAGWLPYFKVFGIRENAAWQLMPLVGTMDIGLGVAALLAPRRALFLYMGIWGLFTALLRPAAGEGGWEFIERAYNYGGPFALLLLHRFGHGQKGWFARIETVPSLTEANAATLLWFFRAIVALMLIGHGGFGAFMGKRNQLEFYRGAGLGALGLPLETVRAVVGVAEIGLGVAAIFARRPGFFLAVCAWKIASESLYIVSGAQLACWEVVERGGSYVAPLCALCLISRLAAPRNAGQTRQCGVAGAAV